MPNLYPNRIGERVVIAQVSPGDPWVWAYDAKPATYRLNRNGKRVCEFDPRCVQSVYHKDSLRILEDRAASAVLRSIRESY